MLVLAPASIARAGDVRGRVLFRGSERPIVCLRGNGMVTTRRGGPVTHECTVRDGAPEPRVLVVRAGDAIRFTNGDAAPRRVFLFEGSETADLGLLGPGDAAVRSFSTFGPAEWYSDAPGAPAGVVLVVENPYFTETDADGRFLLDGVVEGAYDVWAWLPLRRMDRAAAAVPFAGEVEVTLRVGRAR